MMRMERKYVVRRRVVFAIMVLIVSMLFGYATHDVCYVGQPDGNWLGYGSCTQMIDNVLNQEGK
jgi:hypothetical protein